MCIHPDLTGQLVGEHRRQLLAAASRRQLRREQGRQAAGTANGGVGTVTRRIATAIAGTRLPALRSSTTGHQMVASNSGASGRPHEAAAMSGRQTD